MSPCGARKTFPYALLAHGKVPATVGREPRRVIIKFVTSYKILGFLSATIFTLGYLPYIISVLKNKSKPHPMTWVLFAFLGGAALFFTVKAGAHETLPFALFNFLMPLILALLSLKYWQGSFSRFDYVCLGFSLLAIITYIIFHNASFSLTLNILGDIFAYLPTLAKTYKDPESENVLPWSLFAIGSALTVIAAIPNFTYAIVVYPAYLAVSDIVMALLIAIRRLKNKSI